MSVVLPPPKLIQYNYYSKTNDRRTMMGPSLLVLVASALEPRPPPGQTAARRRTPAAFTSVGGRLSGWRAGFGAKCCARMGWVFDGTGAGELQVLLVSFLRCRAHTPSLPAPFSGRCSSSRGCRPWQGRSSRYGCRSQLWKVSSVFVCVLLL